MNISEPFIKRPVATSLLMVGVLLMGLLGYYLLPISALPPVDFPTIQVVAQYPGASPDVMASSVTTPLERQFGQISGLATMTSVSSFANSTLTLQFTLERNIDAASQDVQAAINAARGVLPQGMPNPPTYNKVNPADTPILTLALTSDTLPLETVNDLADTVLAVSRDNTNLLGEGVLAVIDNHIPGTPQYRPFLPADRCEEIMAALHPGGGGDCWRFSNTCCCRLTCSLNSRCSAWWRSMSSRADNPRGGVRNSEACNFSSITRSRTCCASSARCAASSRRSVSNVTAAGAGGRNVRLGIGVITVVAVTTGR